jgi:NADH-quinone oxidoreductase subunit N
MPNDLMIILPPLIVTAWAILLLVVDLFIPANRKGYTALFAALGLAAGLGADLALGGSSTHFEPGFQGMAVLDGFAVYANILILASGLLGVAFAYDYLRRMSLNRGEYYVLLMISTAGMMLMVQAYDLIVVFLALELLSIPLYVLSGFARPRAESEESGLKYFLLGAFAAAFFLYGTALVYGATAHTGLPGVIEAVRQGASSTNPHLLLVGAALLLTGLGFKVSAVPFHMWTPDVYQGAPTPVSAWMAVSVKVAGFAILLRIFIIAFPSLAESLAPVLGGVAALTMIVGNLLAIVQENIKRMLAYSSIAHVGYLLMAFAAFGNGEAVSDAVAATLFYLLAYGLTSFAAWGVVIAVEQKEGRGLSLGEYRGLGGKYPWLGLSMFAAMFSFTGIPLTLGFWGKFYIFQAALKGGAVGLALVGLLTSLFSAYYYLRILVIMYMEPGLEQVEIGTAGSGASTGEVIVRQDGWLHLVTILSAAAVVLLAFVPGTVFQMAARAVLRLP